MSIPCKFTLEVEMGKAGLWYMTSPEIKGLLVQGRDLAELGRRWPYAIQDLAAAGDEKCQEILMARISNDQ